jgi:hypothetical protein
VALRDKLVDRVQPFLEPGETVQCVFLAQAGASPYLANSFGLLGSILGVKRRIVAVTDRAVLVLEADFGGTKPQQVLARLPRSTRLGPVKGVWAKAQVNGEKLYVHRRFHKDVVSADGVMSG